MIPKIIHYCWFGGPMPSEMKKCISSWVPKLWANGYELMFWNDNNVSRYLNTENSKYLYNNKCYSFLSDYVRFSALYEYGGLYLDTDVKLINSFDKILDLNTYIGLERIDTYDYNISFGGHIISSAILGTNKNNLFFLKMVSEINLLKKEELYGKQRVLIGEIMSKYVKKNCDYKIVDSIEDAKEAEKNNILPIFNSPTFDSYPQKLEYQDYAICDHIFCNSWVDHEVKKLY